MDSSTALKNLKRCDIDHTWKTTKGCMKCFCYGVPGVEGCQAASLGVETIDHSEGWFVTDLKGQFRIEPYWSASAGSGKPLLLSTSTSFQRLK